MRRTARVAKAEPAPASRAQVKALAEIRANTEKRRELEKMLLQAEAERDRLFVRAHNAGCGKAAIAREADYSDGRVWQIIRAMEQRAEERAAAREAREEVPAQ